MVENLVTREQRFIMSDSSDFVNTGDIVSEKNGFYSGDLDRTSPNPESSLTRTIAERFGNSLVVTGFTDSGPPIDQGW